VVDVFEALGTAGRVITGGYAGALRWAPALYEAAFTHFMGECARGCGVSPVAVALARRLRTMVAEFEPTVIMSTFHLAGQVAGLLREQGWCDAANAVMITEPAAHPAWLHPGIDVYACPYPWVAQYVRRRSAARVLACGPLVAPEFFCGDAAAGRPAMHLRDDERAVLLSTGSWGTGRDMQATVRLLARVHGVRPVVLCARNGRLARRIASVGGALALGWRRDVADLFAAASALLDNAGGGMCAEAFAAGLPVVGWRPLPGHGRLGIETLAAEEVLTLARDEADLVRVVQRLAGPAGDLQRVRARGVLGADPAAALGAWARGAASGYAAPAPPPAATPTLVDDRQR
jgi:UDP-N-acetylglucosamine:LPS N-acetylglucosamine transferase